MQFGVHQQEHAIICLVQTMQRGGRGRNDGFGVLMLSAWLRNELEKRPSAVSRCYQTHKCEDDTFTPCFGNMFNDGGLNQI